MDDVPDRASDEFDQPGTATIDDELAALIRDMNSGLSERDRLLLELADRQGLSGDELAGALGVSRATAYTLVGRARATARTSIGALLVARTGRPDCPELDQLLAGWDGQLTTLAAQADRSAHRQMRHLRRAAQTHGHAAWPCSARAAHLPPTWSPCACAFSRPRPARWSRYRRASSTAVPRPSIGPGVGRRPIRNSRGHVGGAGSSRCRSCWCCCLISGGVVVAASTDTTVDGAGAPAIPVLPVITSSARVSSDSSTLSAIEPSDPAAAVGGIDATTTSAPAAPPTPSLTATPTPSVTVSITPSVTPTSSPPSSASSSPPTSTSPSPVLWTVTVKTSRFAVGVSYDENSPTCPVNMTCSYTVADQTLVTVTLTAGTDQRFTAPQSCAKLGTLTCAITITANTAFTVALT